MAENSKLQEEVRASPLAHNPANCNFTNCKRYCEFVDQENISSLFSEQHKIPFQRVYTDVNIFKGSILQSHFALILASPVVSLKLTKGRYTCMLVIMHIPQGASKTLTLKTQTSDL